jgi:hypothetical protein
MSVSAGGISPSRRGSPRSGTLALALRDILIGPASCLILGFMVWRVLRGAAPAFDFRFAYSAAGQRVLSGQSPYLWTALQFRDGHAFVYPALSALLFAPLSRLSLALGALLATVACVALVPGTLWFMRVRDWRVYGVALMWMPFYSGWMTANESLFLMLGVAFLWRSRDHPVAAGLLTAAMISLKPLMWPLALWLLATRRWRASAFTLVWGLALNLVAWSLIGFNQIGAYIHAAATDTTDSWRTGFGLPALLAHFGFSRGVGLTVMLVASTALAVAVVHSGLAKRNQNRALVLALALTLVSSPLLWPHYVVLLIVPLALLRPRLDWVWALPLLMWVGQPAAPVHGWQAIVFWAAAGTMCVALVRRATPEPA